MRKAWLSPRFVAATLCFGTGLGAQAAERNEIPDKYKWNLADLYPSEEAWRQAKDDFAKKFPQFAAFKGHLGDSPDTLFRALDLMSNLDKELSRLSTYASQLHDQDLRQSRYTEMQQAIEQLGVDYHSTASFVMPEILAIDPAKLRGFVAKDARLKEYAFYIEDIIRHRPHTLTPAEEQIMAETGNISGTGEAVHSIFTNADLPYPEVKLLGKKIRLDAAAYTKYRASKDRADRDTVFKAFWGTYKEFTRTLGTTLYAQVKTHLFDKKVRHFGSALEAALFSDNIPTSVYTQLIADVHKNLPTLHRYLGLKQRMLGLKDLRYEDLYAPIVKSVATEYTPEQAIDAVLEAVAPLGSEYVQTLKRGLTSGWTDFLPSTGKRSGAYSSGAAYDVHPYQLLNFMGEYEDVSTLAHESGHSMHSYLSNKTQPFIYHDYSIFVAEVASTLNENFLFHHSLETAKDDQTRLFLLGNYLEGLRTTLYRQTLFAEFELAMHQMAEKGETLTGENLTAPYLALLREYYGQDKGVCQVADLYGVEWAYIPHFYYNFYVFKYATSLVASLSIAKAIREEALRTPPSTATRDAYLKMLASGSSKYPMELLREVGVDMSTSKPFEASMIEMNRVMDEMEAILAKQSKGKAR